MNSRIGMGLVAASLLSEGCSSPPPLQPEIPTVSIEEVPQMDESVEEKDTTAPSALIRVFNERFSKCVDGHNEIYAQIIKECSEDSSSYITFCMHHTEAGNTLWTCDDITVLSEKAEKIRKACMESADTAFNISKKYPMSAGELPSVSGTSYITSLRYGLNKLSRAYPQCLDFSNF